MQLFPVVPPQVSIAGITDGYVVGGEDDVGDGTVGLQEAGAPKPPKFFWQAALQYAEVDPQ